MHITDSIAEASVDWERNVYQKNNRGHRTLCAYKRHVLPFLFILGSYCTICFFLLHVCPIWCSVTHLVMWFVQFDIITSAKEVMLLLPFICLFVG